MKAVVLSGKNLKGGSVEGSMLHAHTCGVSENPWFL